jgi:hypothetical protein
MLKDQSSKCYASLLGDCDGKITKEHFISASLLKHLHNDPEFSISGFMRPGIDAIYSKTPLSMSAKMLCKKHNEDLSELDNEILKISRISADAWAHSSKGLALHCNVRGDFLERWVLKVTIGQAISGNAAKNDIPVKMFQPSVNWLNILFGKTTMPERLGLYFAPKIIDFLAQDSNTNKGAFIFAPLFMETEFIGAMTRLFGFPFILTMAMSSENYSQNPLLEGSLYRPKQTTLHLHQSSLTLKLDW